MFSKLDTILFTIKIGEGESEKGRVAIRMPQELLRNYTIIAIICIIGVVGVSYGMLNDDNLAFIIGLLFVIAGYLLIRRRLKQHIRDNL